MDAIKTAEWEKAFKKMIEDFLAESPLRDYPKPLGKGARWESAFQKIVDKLNARFAE